MELERKVVAVKVRNLEESGIGGEFSLAEGKNRSRRGSEKASGDLLAVGGEGVDIDELNAA